MRVESSGKPDAMKVARPVWGWDRDANFRSTPQLIGDVPSATAILDRFLHHATIIPISGKSYRLRNQNSQPVERDDNSKPANPPTGSPAKKKSNSDTAQSTDEAA